MLKKGVRGEIRDHFSWYLKRVKRYVESEKVSDSASRS